MHELRKDPLLGRWVAVSELSLKPEAYGMPADNSGESTCFLCTGREAETPPEISAIRPAHTRPNTPGWWARAVPSMNPALTTDGDLGRKGAGMYDRMNGIGSDEIIVESPEHNKKPEDAGPEQVRRVIELYRRRLGELQRDARIKYVFISKNSGKWAGAAYSHPHSGVLATPVIPHYIKARLDGAKQYYAYKERCVFCDMMDEELRSGSRIIMESRHFVVFCPFAPSSSFEFWILPRTHRCAFEEMGDDEADDLSVVQATVIKKMRKALGEPSYNYTVHTSPNRIPRRDHWHTLGDDYHWHIEVAPRLGVPSGLEQGSGFNVLTTSPEDAAKYIREA